MAQSRTTISLEEKIHEAANMYCHEMNLKFSNLVERLLKEQLTDTGHLDADFGHEVFALVREAQLAGIDVKSFLIEKLRKEPAA